MLPGTRIFSPLAVPRLCNATIFENKNQHACHIVCSDPALTHESAQPKPGGRRAPEHVVPFGLGEPCHDLLVGIVETLEPPGQPGDRHVTAEHAARGAEQLDEGEDPGGDLLPVPAMPKMHSTAAISARTFAQRLSTARSCRHRA